MSNDAKLYIKDVLALLEIPSKNKKEVQSVLQSSIAEHGLEDASYNAIADELGEPTAVASVYAEHFAAFDRLAARKHRKIIVAIWGIIAAVVVALAILVTTFVVKQYLDLKAYDSGYYVETISVGDSIPSEGDA